MPSRLLTALTLVALAAAAAAVGVWSAFLVPLRLPGGVAGLADVIGLVGAAALGVLGVWGLRSLLAGVLPGMVMLVVTGVAGIRSAGGGLVIPGSIDGDSAIGTVGMLLLLAEIVGVAIALIAGSRMLHPRSASAEDKERDRAR